MKQGLFIVMLLFPLCLFAQEFMFIQSKQAKIMSEPSFKSEQISTLNLAEKVEVLEKSKRWYKIRHQEVTGWVSKLLLVKQAPIQKPSVLSGSNTELQQSARRRASGNATAAATRGLRRGHQSQGDATGKADYPAVKRMESEAVSQEEAKGFLDKRSAQ